jgi:AsmA family protein
MNSPPHSRSIRWRIVLSAAVLLVIVAIIVSAAAIVDTSHGHRAIINHFAKASGRHIQVQGRMKVHLLTPSPSLVAEKVTIGNPPWTAPGTLARIDKLSLTFEFPLPWRRAAIRRLEMQGASLNLTRDAEGRGNWFSRPPGSPRAGRGRLIRSISIPDARVVLNDQRRHLEFTGKVSATDAGGGAEPPHFRIRGAGNLNGRAATIAINADPLASASYERPFRFAFSEHSEGSRLIGRGRLHRPFSLDALDVSFEAAGKSMHDLYYLVGVTWPESARFTLTGKLTRNEKRFAYDNLLARFGKSDLGGRVVTDTVSGRPRLDAVVRSKSLQIADFGVHEADGTRIQSKPKKFLLSEAKLPVGVFRRRDGTVQFHADNFQAGAISLQAFAAKATIDNGILTVPELTATYRQSRVSGHFKTDVKPDRPQTQLEFRVAGLELDQFGKAQRKPPLAGLLQAHVQVSGHGQSIHELAASANGTLTAVLPKGAMRSSLADATGVSLRAVGLMLSGDQETPVRCALASFRAKDGKLNTEHFVIDTESVLIDGSGTIDLGTETLDLTMRGHPKKVRIGRLRTPLYVRGQLAHPSFAISGNRLLGQAGAAVAIGLAVAPAAAVLALVDPGLAKNADCATLTSQAR